RAAPPRWQGSTDHRDDTSAGCEGVAPGARNRERKISNARLRRRRREHAALQPRHAQDRHAGGGIPPRKLRVERASLVLAYAQAILAAKRAHGRDDDIRGVNDAGGGTTAALHLDDRWRGAGDHVRHLGRKVSKHAVIVAGTCARYITRSGRAVDLQQQRLDAMRVNGRVAGRPGKDGEPAVLRRDQRDGPPLVVHELRRREVPGAAELTWMHTLGGPAFDRL